MRTIGRDEREGRADGGTEEYGGDQDAEAASAAEEPGSDEERDQAEG